MEALRIFRAKLKANAVTIVTSHKKEVVTPQPTNDKVVTSVTDVTTKISKAEIESIEKFCNQCLHFQKDLIGDGGGIGCCKIEAPESKIGLMWYGITKCCSLFSQIQLS